MLKTRRSFLKLAFTTFSMLRVGQTLDGLSQELPQRLRIVENGTSYATIGLGPGASKKVQEAAGLLAQYFSVSTGAALEISDKPTAEKPVQIHVGTSDYVTQQVKNLQELDADGFVIDFPNQNNIIIVGPTDWGTEFGVYEFLERYLGVRWLLPGPDGEYVPQHRRLDIPVQSIRQQPAFFSRLLSGFSGQPQEIWARRQRMHGRIEFHHNLLKLFPPEKYTKTHPEFFPMRKGKRYLPPDNKTHGWQPCFGAPGIVEEAIKNILIYFTQHPDATSYSLGVNDNRGFCECAECLAKYGDRKNFLGVRDYSDQYFEWANAVVEGVLKKFPDKWFGCLAYREVAQPPSKVPVHPRIIPYLTYDRMKWIDRSTEAEGKRITQWWQTKASALGWYDYLYGTPYCLPRVYFHKMADYYRYGSMHGVRAMYAEAYPNWGEGPKLYAALKLQWNPTLDIDSLLRDWYEKTVGKEAAPELKAYYTIWEKFWTQTIASSPWFSRSEQYLNFTDSTYLEMVTDQISQSRKLLESVVAKTTTKDQRARAHIILRAFEYYEASTISYLGLKKGSYNPSKGGQGLPRGKQPERKYFEDMRNKRLELTEKFQNDPVLTHPNRFDKYDTLKW